MFSTAQQFSLAQKTGFNSMGNFTANYCYGYPSATTSFSSICAAKNSPGENVYASVLGDKKSKFESRPKEDSFSKNKPNHSLIEKRRRDKMRILLQDLAAHVPMCRSVAGSKLDKFTVLKLAIQHMHAIKNCSTTPLCRKTITGKQFQINDIFEKNKNEFFGIISCDRGIFYYASHSIVQSLHFHPSDVAGNTIFDFLQISDSERFRKALTENIDKKHQQEAKLFQIYGHTKTAFSSMHASGGILININCKIATGNKDNTAVPQTPQIKTHANSRVANKDPPLLLNKFVPVKFSGLIRNMPECLVVPAQLRTTTSNTQIECFMFICSVLPSMCDENNRREVKSIRTFGTRLNRDGVFEAIQGNVEDILGYTKSDIIGRSIFDFILMQDREIFKLGMEIQLEAGCKETQKFPSYRLHTRTGEIAVIKSECSFLSFGHTANTFLVFSNVVGRVYKVNKKQQKRKCRGMSFTKTKENKRNKLASKDCHANAIQFSSQNKISHTGPNGTTQYNTSQLSQPSCHINTLGYINESPAKMSDQILMDYTISSPAEKSPELETIQFFEDLSDPLDGNKESFNNSMFMNQMQSQGCPPEYNFNTNVLNDFYDKPHMFAV